MRIHVLAGLAVLAASLTSCVNFNGWQTVHGTGNIITESREVAGFDQVSVSGAGELELVQGNEESLTIETDDNLLPFVRSEVDHGGLHIGPRDVNLRPSRAIIYRLKVKNIKALDLSGSVQAKADSIEAERLDLRISGSGSVNVAQLNARTLSTHISGSGNTSAAGRADQQQISISGSGNHHASGLECSQAEARISGSGHASLWVVQSLNAHITGSGSVEYRGNPNVKSHVSGSGRVHHRSG